MLPPWHFRLAKGLIRAGVRGPGLWLRLAHRMGLLDQVVTYQIDGVEIDVPLGRWENLWDSDEVRAYEAKLLDLLAPRLRDFARSATLVDCGADIGLFTLLLAVRGVRFDRVLACEPNPAPLAVLKTNLSRLSASYEVQPLAVSDFVGTGRLVAPAYDRSAHAWHLAADATGPVQVTTLDELLAQQNPGTDLVVKLDVEGGERAVIRGGKKALQAAGRLTLVVEAHPRVAERTGIDPLEPVRELASLRHISVLAAERPDQPVDLQRPFFEQFPAEAFNLIVEG